jgi:hypothetical protein
VTATSPAATTGYGLDAVSTTLPFSNAEACSVLLTDACEQFGQGLIGNPEPVLLVPEGWISKLSKLPDERMSLNLSRGLMLG